jgi:hypothetical protein
VRVTWLLLLATLASAHPLGAAGASDPNGGMPGQRAELSVTGGELRVDYFAEVAALRLYKEARAEGASGPSWAMGRAESLRAGVKARYDGQTLPLEALPVDAPAELQPTGYVEFHLAARAPLPSPPGTLEFRMDNYPDEACYYAVSVRVGGEFVVTETGLGRVLSGRLRDNLHGAWRRSDAGRLTTLTLRAARPWEDSTPGPLPERLEGLVGLREGLAPLAALLAALGAAALLRGLWGTWRRRSAASAP